MISSRPRDIRLFWFYVLLAWGTLAHEFTWIVRNVVADELTLSTYLSIYNLLLPTPRVPESIVFITHITLISLCLAILVVRRKDLLAYAMFPVILALFLIQGTKPANHLIFLVFVYSIHALYGLLELWRLREKDPVRNRTKQGQNLTFLRFNLVAIMIITYITALLAKLNYGFFKPLNSAAGGFVVATFAPFFKAAEILLPVSADFDEHRVWWCGVVGISFTLFFEAGIPLCFLVKRWRRVGLVLAVWFHLLILYHSAIDYSLVIVSVYPFLLSRYELGRFLLKYLRRTRPFAVWSTTFIAGYLIFDHLLLAVWFGHQLGAFEVYRIVNTVGFTYVLVCLIPFTLRTRTRIPALYYDGHCPHCLRWVGHLRRFDLAGLKYFDLGENAHPLKQSSPESELCLIVGTKAFVGADAIIKAMLYTSGPLVPVGMLLSLPGMRYLARSYLMRGPRRLTPDTESWDERQVARNPRTDVGEVDS